MNAQEKYTSRMLLRSKKVKKESRGFKISPAAKKDILDYLSVKFEGVLDRYRKDSRRMKGMSNQYA